MEENRDTQIGVNINTGADALTDGNQTTTSTTFHSEEVQDIMGRKPAWMLRWGISVIVAVLAGIIIACWFIRYPQTITGTITISSDNPPATLTAKSSGILEVIYANDGDSVRDGQLIAVIANAADYGSIVSAEAFLDYLDRTGIVPDDSLLNAGYGYRMGDIQQSWSELLSVCADFRDYLRIDKAGKQLAMMEGQLWRTMEYYRKLENQRKIIEADLNCERTSLGRDSLLFARKVLSRADYEKSFQAYMSKKNELAGFDATMANAHVNRLQLEQQILELKTGRDEQSAEYARRMARTKKNLAGDIALWKERYAIISPCGGTVSMRNVWSAGQHVNSGEVIVDVTPEKRSPVLGRAKVPSTGFGKVKEGQEVNIKLNGFPYLEFGMLRGKVHSISQVPERTEGGLFYTVEISLPNRMESTYRKTLPFVQDMDGTAEIVTEDMRLLEQFIQPVRSLFTN